MKKLICISLLAVAVATSCTDMLMEDNKTKVTTEFIYTDPEGLAHGVIALYPIDRNLISGSGVDQGGLASALFMDGTTDILMFRAGPSAISTNLNLNSENADVKYFWNNRYQLIGRANELIFAAETRMDIEDPAVRKSWGAAKLFRARAYFDLVRRFERVWLNTKPTTLGNLEVVKRPAKQSAVFALICQDLDDAISGMDWTVASSAAGKPNTGEMTKAVAYHVRAQVAMWLGDWDKAIECCEAIFARSEYGLMPAAIDCFTGANLECKEMLAVYPYSRNVGGGGYMSSANPPKLMGHRLSLSCTPAYHGISGMKYAAEYGGYGWGRFYPNTYLLGLYDQVKDKRYKELFHDYLDYKYNNADALPAGKSLGDLIPVTKSAEYTTRRHTSSLKYFDRWTNADDPSYTTSFKDVPMYRLAETYLMASEAYMMRYGGGHSKAVEYYNKTWQRAGNDRENGPITIEMIVDEHARECHFEGSRFYLLKRLGILIDRVKRHAGDTDIDDPLLDKSYIQARQAITDRDTCWPIPQDEVDLMGEENFPQNEGW